MHSLNFKIILFLLLTGSAFGAVSVDTLSIISSEMDTTLKAIVVVPDADTPLPVVYLLHGWSGNYRNWYDKTDLAALAETYNMIIVCPDGGYAGWYLDSPLQVKSRYESHIIQEVIPHIDQHYATIADSSGRFLCGLSMGGHGAVRLLCIYPGMFTAAGSMSGVLELTGFEERYGLHKLLGDYETNHSLWTSNSCLFLVDRIKNRKKGLIIDCGIDDRFLDSNRRIHEKLIDLGVGHDYYERPGGHSWTYWTKALPYHLLYFRKLFDNPN